MRQRLFLENKSYVFKRLKREQDQHIKKVADDLLHGKFIFNEPWDMEKCLTCVQFQNLDINWHHIENGDVEWMFMLNRHRYLVTLLQQYIASEDEKYYCGFQNILQDWMKKEIDFVGRETTSWRTIDTGIRLKYWIQCLEYIDEEKICSSEFLQCIEQFVIRQIEYLMDSYNVNLSLSNWRILEFHGVFIAACYFRYITKSEEWIQESLEILERCLMLQVTNDGFHWEQSFMYHHEVMICALEVLMVAKRADIQVSEIFRQKVKDMIRASSHLVRPDGSQSNYGDSDVEDMKEILTLCALVFPELSVGNKILESASLSLLLRYGGNAENEIHKLNRSALKELDYAHEDVGNYFARTGWGESDSWLFFKNGFLGSGHGHCDLLHFEMIVKGVPVLVDSGRYTYRYDREERQKYKSASAHNTFVLDQKEFTLQKRAWGTRKVANEVKRPAIMRKDVILFQGTHLGYIEDGIIVNRKIVWIKPGIWILTDEIKMMEQKKHSFQQYFHFYQNGVSVEDKSFRYQEKGVEVCFVPMYFCEIEKSACKISPTYNQEYDSCKVVLESQYQKDVNLTVIMTDETEKRYAVEKLSVFDMNNQKVDSCYAEALRIKDEKNEWIVCMNHGEEPQGRKLYLVEGIPVYGKTNIVKCEIGQVKEQFALEY